MSFRLVPNRWPWMALNGVMAVIFRYFTEFGALGAHYVKVVKDTPMIPATQTEKECIMYNHLLIQVDTFRDSVLTGVLWSLIHSVCPSVRSSVTFRYLIFRWVSCIVYFLVLYFFTARLHCLRRKALPAPMTTIASCTQCESRSVVISDSSVPVLSLHSVQLARDEAAGSCCCCYSDCDAVASTKTFVEYATRGIDSPVI